MPKQKFNASVSSETFIKARYGMSGEQTDLVKSRDIAALSIELRRGREVCMIHRASDGAKLQALDSLEIVKTALKQADVKLMGAVEEKNNITNTPIHWIVPKFANTEKPTTMDTIRATSERQVPAIVSITSIKDSNGKPVRFNILSANNGRRLSNKSYEQITGQGAMDENATDTSPDLIIA